MANGLNIWKNTGSIKNNNGNTVGSLRALASSQPNSVLSSNTQQNDSGTNSNNIWSWNTNYKQPGSEGYDSNLSQRQNSFYIKNMGNKTILDIPAKDPEPEALTQLRQKLGENIMTGLDSFDTNSWQNAHNLNNQAMGIQSNLLGQLTGDNNILSQNNNLVNEIANIARTGNIPSGLYETMNARVNNDLKSGMGSLLNNLASRGVLNSSVANTGINNLAQNAANAFNQNYLQAYNSVMSGLGQTLQGSQSNLASLLSALGQAGNVPSQAYQNIGAGLTPANTLLNQWQNAWLQYDPYQTTYDPGQASSSDRSCLTGDTLVTLEDGREIPISELKENDKICVWDFNEGKLTSAPLTALFKRTHNGLLDVIRVEFDDGSSIGVIVEHLFFDLTEGKFIAINSDSQEYVGHDFAKVNSDGKVVPVKVTKIYKDGKTSETFSAQGEGHLNYLAGRLITGNDGQLGLCNRFEFDTEKMIYDTIKKAEDLEKYGLLDYECLKDVVTKEYFDANHGEEFSVVFGKGLMTADELTAYLSKLAQYFIQPKVEEEHRECH